MATYWYQGDTTASSKRMYTWDGKYLYQGDTTASSKRMYTFDGPFPAYLIPVLI